MSNNFYTDDIQTGRNVYVDKDLYESDESYKARIDSYVKEGFALVFGTPDNPSSGGGGSSDFSTAMVSIANTNGNANLDFYGIVDNSYVQAMLKSDGDYLASYSWIGETNTTAEFLMVQDSFMIAVPMVEPTITGNATKEYLSEYSEWDVTITGDCTITIS